MPPGVSVLVPAYNVAPWVAAALDSALASCGVDLEVIVVDDASTDDTLTVVEAYARRDPRVVVVRQAQNGGVSAARNAALARATKLWVAVLDADDALEPDRLAHLVAVGEAARADIVSDDVAILHESDSAPQTSMYAVSGWPWPDGHLLTLAEHAEMDWILKPLVRRAFLDRHGLRYDEAYRHDEDFLLHADSCPCMRSIGLARRRLCRAPTDPKLERVPIVQL